MSFFSEDNRPEESSEDLPVLELAISTIPHPFPPSYQVLADTVDYNSLTRSSSTSSLPALSFDESWFLTPPPCFTLEGPIHMETSPMENLLIEHPSMSVYQHSPSTRCSLPRTRHRSGSTGTAHDSPASHFSSDEADAPEPHLDEVETVSDRRHSTVQTVPRQRQAVYSLHQQEEKQCLQIRSAQKVSRGYHFIVVVMRRLHWSTALHVVGVGDNNVFRTFIPTT